MSEYPEPNTLYYVSETFRLARRSRTEWVSGPFEAPDGARRERDRMRRETPSRDLHCVEVRSYDLPDPPVRLPTNEERIAALKRIVNSA